VPSTNKPNRKYRHVCAVVRVDIPIYLGQPEASFTVVKVFSSEEEAEKGTSRLSKINANKDCKYFTRITRMVD
jgi:hypothetical protein